MILLILLLLSSNSALGDQNFLEITTIDKPNDDHQYNLNLQDEDQDNKHVLFYYHKWCNFIAWGILADFGILANRYGFHNPYRLLIHSIIMGLCVIATVLAEIEMILFWNPPTFYGNQNLASFHAPIGFTYLGLMIIQGIGGIILKLCVESKNQQPLMKYQSLFHFYLGYTLYFLGKIQCGLGFYEVYAPIVGQGQTNLIIFWIIYSLLFFWRIIFEWLYFSGKLYKILSDRDVDNQKSLSIKDSMLMQCILQNDYVSLEKDYSDQMWFIFNNQIVNLTGFVHPGGQYIWEKTRGREISRFIYGGQSLEDGSCKPYKHSEKAIFLLNQKTIGDLNHNNHLLSSRSISIQQNESLKNIWQLVSVNIITDNIYQFGFKNQSIKISNETQSLHSFGRYFQIQALNNQNISIRQYTQVLSMAQENVLYREQLISLILQPSIHEQQLQNINKPPNNLNELPLIIKKYQSINGFSQFIHSRIEQEFEITGPLGPSLPISRKSNIVLICGGTGIFPFLDLLDFHLQSTIFKIINSQFGKEKASLLFNPFDYDFDNDLKITLIFAVANKKELIGSDIYFTLQQIQNRLSESSFKMILKIKEKIDGITCVDERFSTNFFSKYLENINQYDSFFICGPPLMTQSVPLNIQELGVPKNKIHFI